ncbi:PREDICTED: uncharacterized protein LOC109352924 [Lupinus angustifolius]|uniref:uncharacterized protein LOC109352924 n=1 Tax=Lupinus angustifolius TaxID=3871 RepID=UPI00092E41EC|nr:PREDICTED: uncharacterized protein LOC109352924 [Lupinus angustifolius]
MPLDVNLQKRGIHLASSWSICHAAEESSNHLFLQCTFATDLWHWLENIIDLPLDSSSIQSLLRVCKDNWSPQLTLVVTASIVNIISTICRFNCSPHYNLAPAITEVRWLPPPQGWIKVNSDGAAHGHPGHAGGGGIFRDSNEDMLGCFAAYFHIHDSLFAELHAAIMAIQIASLKGWREVWLECDSSLVVEIVKGIKDPPWKLSNYWEHCKMIISSIKYRQHW